MTELVIDIDTFEVEEVEKTDDMNKKPLLLFSLVVISFKTTMIALSELIKQRLYEHFKRKEKPNETVFSSS